MKMPRKGPMGYPPFTLHVNKAVSPGCLVVAETGAFHSDRWRKVLKAGQKTRAARGASGAQGAGSGQEMCEQLKDNARHVA